MVKRKTGFTLIEVLIAFAILTILSFLIIYFLIEVRTGSLANYKNFLALAELRQNAEATLSLRKKSFDSFIAGRYYLKFDNLLQDWVFIPFSLEQNDRYFIKEIIIEDAKKDLKKVTINIYSKENYNLDSKPIFTVVLYLAKLKENINSKKIEKELCQLRIIADTPLNQTLIIYNKKDNCFIVGFIYEEKI